VKTKVKNSSYNQRLGMTRQGLIFPGIKQWLSWGNEKDIKELILFLLKKKLKCV